MEFSLYTTINKINLFFISLNFEQTNIQQKLIKQKVTPMEINYAYEDKKQ